MTKGPHRKAQQRRKRQEKKRLTLRASAGSAYRRIGASGQLVACYINDGWREDALASIYVLRRVPDGGHALGAYLVDLGCAGLKEAYGRLDITHREFEEMIFERMPPAIEMVATDLDLVRRLVAGGIRFAHQNGFRLPPRYERWVALLGDVGDWRSADLTDFGVDGCLNYVGSMKDLKRRLVGCTVEEFLARDNVDFTLADDGFTLLDDDTLAVEQVAEQMRKRGLNAVRQWCFANGVVPHPRLAEAWDLTIASLMELKDVPDDEEDVSDEAAGQAAANLNRLLSFEGPASQVQLAEAVDQIRGFMARFESPDALFEALDLDEEELE